MEVEDEGAPSASSARKVVRVLEGGSREEGGGP